MSNVYLANGIEQAPMEDLWTQREAAAFLKVSSRYLRDSTCPKIYLPGTGTQGRGLVRYVPAQVRAWARAQTGDAHSGRLN